ncbi:MAG: hypothetical protein DCC49_05510 [Acidobacteria bacterium]|nr:MAG: hypothetical protein DCC49_05510 [Acidobacteriota bacterium]
MSRRGDFRVIYRIDERDRTVYIESIAHRSDIYRTR